MARLNPLFLAGTTFKGDKRKRKSAQTGAHRSELIDVLDELKKGVRQIGPSSVGSYLCQTPSTKARRGEVDRHSDKNEIEDDASLQLPSQLTSQHVIRR